MALTKAQYDSILRNYEYTRDRNRHALEERLALVYERIPAYKEIEESIGSTSVSHARMLLDGNEAALRALKDKLKETSRQKKLLLEEAGFPEDYLDPIYDCPACKDTGYINGEKCTCFRQQEITLLYEQSNIRDMIEKENFTTLSLDYQQGDDRKRLEAAVNKCMDFVKTFKEEYQNLFLYGTVGTGKSFLSGCIAKELLADGYSVIYFSANRLFESLSNYSFDTKMKEALYNFNKDLYNCDLVIIDDLGTEFFNGFVSSQFFGLINERHLRQKSTIISTNLTLEDFRDRYSDRIFSRITSNYTLLKLSGQDIRMQKKIAHKA